MKNSLIKQGYSKKDVDEAFAVAMNEIPAPSFPPKLQSNYPSISGNDTSKAAIAYVLTWLTGLIIFLITPKEDKFTRFHAMQAIFLGIAMTVIYIVLSVALLPLFFFGGFFIMPLLWLLGIAVIIIMAVNAYKGNKTKIPLIGNLAENIVEKD